MNVKDILARLIELPSVWIRGVLFRSSSSMTSKKKWLPSDLFDGSQNYPGRGRETSCNMDGCDALGFVVSIQRLI